METVAPILTLHTNNSKEPSVILVTTTITRKTVREDKVGADPSHRDVGVAKAKATCKIMVNEKTKHLARTQLERLG